MTLPTTTLDRLLEALAIDPHGLEATRRQLIALVQDRNFLRALRELERRPHGVVNMSYVHPNQFIKLVLGQRVDGWRLVAHCWREIPSHSLEAVLRLSDVHNHRWPFLSVVLQGVIIDVEFRPSAEGQQYAEYRYQSNEGTPTMTLTDTGRFSSLEQYGLHPVSAGSLESSTFYRQKDTLHAAFPEASTPTVTLVLQAPTQADITTVYRHPSAPEVNLATPHISRASRRSYLELVASLVEPHTEASPGSTPLRASTGATE